VEYATAYDVGDRKRDDGINEDSVAIAVIEDGHRVGLEGSEDADTRGAVAFALADGAGGHDAGDVASYIASTVAVEELAGKAARWIRSDPGAFGVALDMPLPDGPTAVSVQSAVDEAIQVVLDGRVIKVQLLGDLVPISRLLREQPDDPEAVVTAT